MKKLATREQLAHFIGNSSFPYFDIKKHGSTYRAVDPYGFAVLEGKELKGYLGDIIYPQYDGEKYLTGDYRLTSDRHGMICKWKEKEEVI